MEEETDEYLDRFVSQAPLHLAYSGCRYVDKKQLHKLIEAGYEIKRGRFSRQEDKRIRKNWRRICRKFPSHSDPFEAFGVCAPPKTDEPQSEEIECNYLPKKGRKSCTIIRKYQQIHFLQRLAYKLDDRLICDIYVRSKKIIAYKNYRYTSRSQVPEEAVEEAIVDLFEEKAASQKVSSKFNISPIVLQTIKINPIRKGHYRWKTLDDDALAFAIRTQFDGEDPKSIPTFKINWNKAADEMRTYGYNLFPSQLYKRWHKLNNKMVGLNNSFKTISKKVEKNKKKEL